MASLSPLSPLSPAACTEVLDTHCHLHTGSGQSQMVGAGAVSMAVAESDDWDMLAEWLESGPDSAAASASASPWRIGGYGTHPWYATSVVELPSLRVDDLPTDATVSAAVASYIARLGDRLDAAAAAGHTVIVGEIGVDKFRGWHPQAEADGEVPDGYAEMSRNGRNRLAFNIAQKPLFEAQFDLAAARGLPVSIHCVQAGGYLFEFLASASRRGLVPSGVALHSVSLKAGLITSLLAIRGPLADVLFFGLSPAINYSSPRSAKLTDAAIALIPREQVLLESDLEEYEANEQAADYTPLVAALAVAWDATLAEVIAITSANARRWLAGLAPSPVQSC
ncbi:uncharacterized protein AMSG_08275 [Thecamonas trahens ATCC 50062]|uniref:Uncharacterized protein n=1 Tax=Thecamonas trahens ATCC 50062 TaxID=461836 RepID=A0A0L0DI83_THETB|nr:hypothetical protein AMSG_08275 [Thecamonas trahens ATCC 50062]KNC52022.1 hypothetical protein AMSG_08275 [Thecamonas trahens ATCC 50062]|eukprot:XP_013755605.1 hypothetical protein AMSG_08275 [Thecamonas trahens ATCC 50062]